MLLLTLLVTLPIRLSHTLTWSTSKLSPKQTTFYCTSLRHTEPSHRQRRKCHFCLEKITTGQFMVFKQPCCKHHTHTECFKTWTSHTESTVRCTHCRTTYQYEDKCFLCLQEYTKKLNCTICCHTKVTRNAQQISQLCSHSYPLTTRWNAGNSLIVTNSGYIYDEHCQTVYSNGSILKQFYLKRLLTLNSYINCSLFISNSCNCTNNCLLL